MNSIAERFKAEILSRLEKVTQGQDYAIHKAGAIFAETIQKGGIIRAFGSGHSYANALEISGRAGGYIQTRVIKDPAEGLYEMINGTGEQLMTKVDLRPEDCLVVISNSGRNPLGIEMARIARSREVKVIAITALAVSQASASRSSGGKRLFEFADVVLDNKSSYGDACLEIEGIDAKVGATSLYTGCLLLDCVVMESLEILLAQGIDPPIYKSSNIDGGPEHNQELVDRFRNRLSEF